MPSGPKKRLAARRRSMGRPSPIESPDNALADKASGSESHVSDEGMSPVAAEERSSRLSLPAGASEMPADQSFQTEEWVRVSDFDVGTPTSTAAKSDFEGQDGVGDARGHDKLVDWETVSRDNAGNSSSAEEVGDSGEHLGAGDSGSRSGRKQGQASSGSDSEKEDDGKSSSRSGRSSPSSGSDAYPKKSDDEERSSGIVVVPHDYDSRESSYAEVASVDAREDECHRNVSSPEGKEGDYQASSAIEPASSEEQEEDSYEHYSGVDDHASSAIEPASSDEQEEEKYRLFSDLSNVKDLDGVHSGSESVDLSSLIRGEEKSDRDEVHSPERNMEQRGSAGEESTPENIEPTTPEKTSEKSFAESPYAFVRAVSDGEILEPVEAGSPEVDQAAHDTSSLAEAQGGEENVAKEAHDTSFGSVGGVAEPSQEELKQLLEIAQSKEVAVLGKQEEKILAHEEQELGKGSVESQPIVDILSATDPSKPMEGGELEDLQPVRAEEAPLLKDSSSSPVHSDLISTIEVKDRVPEVFTDKSGEESLEESQGGVRGKHRTAEASLMDGDAAPTDLSTQTKLLPAGESPEKEQSLEEKSGSEDLLAAVDLAGRVESKDIPTENVKGALVPLSTLTDSEWPKSSAESTKDVEATFEAENVDRTERIPGSSEKHEQVAHHGREDQARILGPIQTSSDTWGCCEPVQWLFENFRRWVNPPAIRN